MHWQEWMQSGAWQDRVDTAMPMLPSLANQVVHLAMDPEVSATRMTSLVSKDPVLAARVIRLANSGFSAPAMEIVSVGDAVLRVGTRAVRNAVLTECLNSRVMDQRIYGRHGRNLIDHAVGTAYLAWLLAERGQEAPDEAFLYGLLHDIGKMLILKLAFDFSRETQQPVDEDVVAEFIRDRHAELGARLLRRWELPENLKEPVLYHHEPGRANGHWRAAAVAYAANTLAHRYGFGCPVDAPDAEALLADPVFTALGIDAVALAETDSHAPGLFEVARQITK